ncbi:LysR substrate-binding domain-containing protein [Streptomyces sp. NBC_01465]|nr:LysR substrate-binding domain-containing protein [Streptomyces sp. NBC_01465]
MWDYDWSRIDREDVVVTPLLDDPPALLVSDQHPFAGRESATLADLADDPWITRAEHHPVAEALDRSCRAAGIGVALAPTLALEGIRPGISVLPLLPPAPVRRILLVRMVDHALTPAADIFTQLLLDTTAARLEPSR